MVTLLNILSSLNFFQRCTTTDRFARAASVNNYCLLLVSNILGGNNGDLPEFMLPQVIPRYYHSYFLVFLIKNINANLTFGHSVAALVLYSSGWHNNRGCSRGERGSDFLVVSSPTPNIRRLRRVTLLIRIFSFRTWSTSTAHAHQNPLFNL